MDTEEKGEYEFVAYNRKDGKGFDEEFTDIARRECFRVGDGKPDPVVEYLDRETYREYTTDNWQRALDYRSERNALSRGRYNIRLKTIIGVWHVETKKLCYPIVITDQDALQWSNFVKERQDRQYMESKYNRVERRLMNEIREAERVERRLVNEIKEAEKSLDETMFANTPFKSKGDLDRNLGARVHASDEAINPKHYKMIPKEAYSKYPEGLEYMDLMEYILERHEGVEGHILGQIFKYACRLGRKDSIVQDAKKIEWYANRLVRVLTDE